MDKVWAIVPAAGSGVRLGASVPKAFVNIGVLPMLHHAILSLAAQGVEHFVIALPPGFDAPAMPAGEFEILTVPGGEQRQDSVLNAAAALPSDYCAVLIHDAARPFLRAGLVADLLAAARSHGAAVPVLPVVDTLKKLDGNKVIATVSREGLAGVQTPQCFSADLFKRMLPHYRGMQVTDDCAIAESLGVRPAAVPGSPLSFKVTTQHDLQLARLILASEELG
jgi:2-C-methyl-D-erythritol 4-phosphate cytidylyltransferase